MQIVGSSSYKMIPPIMPAKVPETLRGLKGHRGIDEYHSIVDKG